MKKSISSYIRSLHRDLGFLIIGLVCFFALSGIVLVYRDTDFMKRDEVIEKTLPPNLASNDLASALKLKNLKVVREDSSTVVFAEGTYSKTTGLASYTASKVIFPFNKFISLHKSVSQSPSHWAVLLFGGIMLFQAISAFWIFKSSTKQFKRGMGLTIAGMIVAVLLLFSV